MLRFELTDRYQSIDMVYKAGSQTQWHLMAARLTVPIPQVVYTTDENGRVRVVREDDTVRTYTFTIDLDNQPDPDAVMAKIKRWVDGANSQACRSYTIQNTLPVHVLTSRPNTAGRYLSRVIYGVVDDGGVYTNVNMVNNEARGVNVTLVCEPYSEAMFEVIRDNVSGARTTAAAKYGITAINGESTFAPTTVGTESSGPITGKAYYCTATGLSATGANGLSVGGTQSVPGNTTVRAFVWWRSWYVDAAQENTIVIRLRNTSAGVDNDRKEIDPDNMIFGVHYDATATDKYGEVWYRTPLVAYNESGSSQTFEMQVLAYLGTDFKIDGEYLEIDNEVERDNLFESGYMDGDVGGLVRGFSQIGTPTTSQIDFNAANVGGMFGRYTQKVETNADDEGVYFDLSTELDANAERYTAVIWVHVESGEIEITEDNIQIYPIGVNNGFSGNTGYIDDVAGNRFYRFVVSRAVDSPTWLILRQLGSGTAVFYVASMFVYDDTSTELIPSSVSSPWAAGYLDRGWTNRREWSNRSDYTGFGSRDQVYYNEVADIPGDAPAWMQLALETTNFTGSTSYPYTRMLVSRISGPGEIDVVDVLPIADGNNTLWSIGTATGWTDSQTTGSWHGGTRYNINMAVGSATANDVFCDLGSDLNELRNNKYRMYLHCNMFNINTLEVTSFSAMSVESKLILVGGGGGTDYFVDLGTLYPTDFPDSVYPASATIQGLTLHVERTGTNATMNIYAMYLVPYEDDGFAIAVPNGIDATSLTVTLLPKQKAIVQSDHDFMTDVIGSCFTVYPGVTNKVSVLLVNSLGDLIYDQEGRIRYRFIPRVRHLGVI